MGMDLIGINPTTDEGRHLHLNWTSWGMLGDLLHELGCDLTDMSGSNDGDVIDAATCLAWADALRAGRARIIAVDYPDASYRGGLRTELHAENTDTPVLLSTAEQARVFAHQVLGVADLPAADTPDVPPRQRPVSADADQSAWLDSIESFLRTCGGAEQC